MKKQTKTIKITPTTKIELYLGKWLSDIFEDRGFDNPITLVLKGDGKIHELTKEDNFEFKIPTGYVT